jgi:hypothetical protein
MNINTFLAVILEVESILKIFFKRFFASFDTSFGTAYFAFYIFLKRSFSNSPKNGSFPVIIIKSITPNAHTSAAYPL